MPSESDILILTEHVEQDSPIQPSVNQSHTLNLASTAIETLLIIAGSRERRGRRTLRRVQRKASD
jgi:hypothetical protein